MVTRMPTYTAQRIEVALDPIVERVNPSPEQRPAVAARGVDVVVHAGAGSGKTRTLVSRFLSLVAEGNALRSVVAITFTEKAALEMRSRLRAAIRDYLQQPLLDGATRAHWEPIERDLDSARIGTIHALCTEILRRHPAEAVIDPAFAVLDAAQSLLLRANALDDALAAAVVDEAAAPLFAAMKVNSVRTLLEEMLDERLAVAEACGDGVDAAAAAQIDEWRQRAQTFMRDGATIETIADLHTLHDYAQEHAAAAGDDGALVVSAALDAWQHALAAESRGDWALMADALRTLAAGLKQKGLVSNWGGHKPKTVFKALKSLLVAACGDSIPDLAADARLLALRPLVHGIYTDAASRYAAARQRLGALDFDDLEAGALALLRHHPAVRAEWQQQVAALLVDEFQDTNARQAELVRLLRAAPGRVFMVGDAQQSIYGFRGADLRVFRAERARVAAEGGAIEALDRSYRTHGALLAAIETLLSPIFDNGAEADFRARYSPLQAMRADALSMAAAPFVEFHLADGRKADAMPCAADALATRLIALRRAGAAWSDMAILCRSSGAFAWYEDALERAAIPNVTVAGRGFYNRPEVRDILNALRAIADPHDNLALVGLLRSPAIGLNDATLMRICTAAPRGERGAPAAGALWQQVRSESDGQIQEAAAFIAELHSRAGRVSVLELLELFLTRSGYSAALIQAGQRRAARNLTKLLDEARAAPTPSVSDFLARITALRSATSREGEARADESGAVQIMSVHAAKGLEFPIVVIGDVGSAGSNRSRPLYVESVTGLRFSTCSEDGEEGLLYATAVQRAKEMDEAEAERILYVAATRAREMLLFSGSVKRRPTPRTGDTCSTSGWLKQMGDAGNLDPLLNAALAAAGVAQQSACGRFVCTIHNPAAAATVATAGALAMESDTVATPEDTLAWEPRMLEPVAFRVADTQRPPRPWRVTTEQAGVHAPAWVIGEVVHEAVAAWRFPDDANALDFAAWADARLRARGVHDEAARTSAIAGCRRLLQRLRNHTLYAELSAAPRRYHELPYQCPLAAGSAAGGAQAGSAQARRRNR